MRYSTVCSLLALAFSSSTAALDIRLHEDGACTSGFAAVCTGINPQACCYATNSWNSAGFGTMPPYGIVEYWDITVATFWLPSCENGLNRERSARRNFVCLRSGKFFSAKYWFMGADKRGVEGPRGVQLPRAEQECQRADTLLLGDGLAYDITKMTDEVLDELVGLAKNGSVTAGALEGFKEYQKNE